MIFDILDCRDVVRNTHCFEKVDEGIEAEENVQTALHFILEYFLRSAYRKFLKIIQ